MWWIGFHAVLFWFLFWDFFVYTYSAANRRKKQAFFSCCPGTDSMITSMNETSVSNGTVIEGKDGNIRYRTSVIERNVQMKEGKDL